jgi:hypothetical protein
MQNEQTPPIEEKVPTKNEIISLLKEQIEVKTLQVELQGLNAQLAKSRAEELQALNFIAQMTNPRPTGDEYDGAIPHTVTKEDLEANPELVDEGIKEGDEILIPNPKKRGLKK